jgi:hypothetical protein
MVIPTARTFVIVRHAGVERPIEFIDASVAIFVTAIVVGRDRSEAEACLEGVL